MKKLFILFLIITSNNVLSQELGDYYNSNDNKKAKDLKFGIRTPIDFKENISTNNNVVKSWSNNNINIEVIVEDVAKKYKKKTKNDWSEMLKSKKFKLKGFHSNYKLITESKYFSVDNYPGLLFINDKPFKQNNSYEISIKVIVEGVYFTLIMYSENKEKLDSYVPLFYELLNSVIFYDQYSNANPVVGKWKIIRETKGGSEK